MYTLCTYIFTPTYICIEHSWSIATLPWNKSIVIFFFLLCNHVSIHYWENKEDAFQKCVLIRIDHLLNVKLLTEVVCERVKFFAVYELQILRIENKYPIESPTAFWKNMDKVFPTNLRKQLTSLVPQGLLEHALRWTGSSSF